MAQKRKRALPKRDRRACLGKQSDRKALLQYVGALTVVCTLFIALFTVLADSRGQEEAILVLAMAAAMIFVVDQNRVAFPWTR